MLPSCVSLRLTAFRLGARCLLLAALLLAGVARAQETVDFLEPRSFPIGGCPTTCWSSTSTATASSTC